MPLGPERLAATIPPQGGPSNPYPDRTPKSPNPPRVLVDPRLGNRRGAVEIIFFPDRAYARKPQSLVNTVRKLFPNTAFRQNPTLRKKGRLLGGGGVGVDQGPSLRGFLNSQVTAEGEEGSRQRRGGVCWGEGEGGTQKIPPQLTGPHTPSHRTRGCKLKETFVASPTWGRNQIDSPRPFRTSSPRVALRRCQPPNRVSGSVRRETRRAGRQFSAFSRSPFPLFFPPAARRHNPQAAPVLPATANTTSSLTIS